MGNKYDTYCYLAGCDTPHLLHYSRTMQYRISTLIQSSNAFSTLIETDAIVATVFVSNNEYAVAYVKRDKKQLLHHFISFFIH